MIAEHSRTLSRSLTLLPGRSSAEGDHDRSIRLVRSAFQRALRVRTVALSSSM
jgi:hypothetical protein